MATYYKLRDNEGSGTEPMPEEKAKAKRREWINRRNPFGLRDHSYQVSLVAVEVTEHEAEMYA